MRALEESAMGDGKEDREESFAFLLPITPCARLSLETRDTEDESETISWERRVSKYKRKTS